MWHDYLEGNVFVGFIEKCYEAGANWEGPGEKVGETALGFAKIAYSVQPAAITGIMIRQVNPPVMEGSTAQIVNYRSNGELLAEDAWKAGWTFHSNMFNFPSNDDSFNRIEEWKETVRSEAKIKQAIKDAAHKYAIQVAKRDKRAIEQGQVGIRTTLVLAGNCGSRMGVTISPDGKCTCGDFVGTKLNAGDFLEYDWNCFARVIRMIDDSHAEVTTFAPTHQAKQIGLAGFEKQTFDDDIVVDGMGSLGQGGATLSQVLDAYSRGTPAAVVGRDTPETTAQILARRHGQKPIKLPKLSKKGKAAISKNHILPKESDRIKMPTGKSKGKTLAEVLTEIGKQQQKPETGEKSLKDKLIEVMKLNNQLDAYDELGDKPLP